MTGETSLQHILKTMAPVLSEIDYVFCTFESARYGDNQSLSPVASFQESEGLTLVIPKHKAEENQLDYEQVFNCITLQVHSSLDAVGLTAALATQLTQFDISANVIAAYFHDHIFVPKNQAQTALKALRKLCQ